MGECWYKDCCVSEHLESPRCGKPEEEEGNKKMKHLIWSEEVQKVLSRFRVSDRRKAEREKK